MNLQPQGPETITGESRFLRNSVGIEYKTAGATLDHTLFGDVAVDGYILAGTAVHLNPETNLYEPWGAETPATAVGAGLTSHDVKLIEGSNPIVGVLTAGHPLEERCIGVNEAFKEATRGYLRFDV